MNQATGSFLDLPNRQFFIDLKIIQILDPNNKRKVLIGGYGWIKQSNNTFIFKIFVNRIKTNSGTISYLARASKTYEGVSYFRCKDHSGKSWKFEGRIKSIPLVFKNETPEIDGYTESINKTHKIPSPRDNSIILIFSNKFIFPHIKNEVTINIDEETYQNVSPTHTIEYESDNLKIHGYTKDNLIHLVFKKKRFSQYYFLRILEGLKFITGQQLKPVSIITSKGNMLEFIYFADFKYESGVIEAPIKIRSQPFKMYKNSWYLFEKFIQYTSQKYKGENYSPLGAEINGQIGVGEDFFSSSLLIMSVGIESLLNILYSKSVSISKEDEKSINQVLDYIKSNRDIIDEKLFGRVMTAVGQMKNIRAKDILLRAKDKGIINDLQFKTWDKVRNSITHGKHIKVEEDWDATYEKFYILLEMFYRLIFYKIGYNGLYTVYSNYLFTIKEENFELYQNG